MISPTRICYWYVTGENLPGQLEAVSGSGSISIAFHTPWLF